MRLPVALAVDVGGTSFKAALVDGDGAFLRQGREPTAGDRGEAAYQRLEAFVAEMLGRPEGRPEVIGLISPGMEEASGRVLFAANLGWRDFPLAARLAERFGLPVAGGHDVRTAGLAEFLLGAARGERDAALVMVGTGIAAAFLSSGQLIAGGGRMAGEIGHIPIYPDGEPCACGQFGCLETYASAAAVARRYRARGGASALGAAEIAARLAEDGLAAAVWGEAVAALALGLATVTLMLDPAVIVLSGGLADAGERLLPPLRAGLQGRLAWRQAPPLTVSSLGGRGALLGAAILGWQRLGARMGDLPPALPAAPEFP
ncbi:ROK family protein [Acidisoma sp. C75]